MDATEASQRLYDLLARFDTTMMVTHAPSGPLDCRPMQVAKSEVEQGGPLWFVTSVQGQVPQEVSSDARTLLIFQGDGHYLAVWGRAEIHADSTLARQLWRDEYRAWVPLGPDDPSLRIVKFIPHSAEFWTDGTDGTLRYHFDGGRAQATQAAREDHGRANLPQR
jgi:general stress protein 26